MNSLVFKKNNKYSALSFFNHAINNLLNSINFDFYRFDLNEIAIIFGYVDKNKITNNDIIYLLKNYNNHVPLFIDLPMHLYYEENSTSLLFSMLNSINAKGVCVDIKYSSNNLIKNLIFENIPVIGYTSESITDYEILRDKTIEFQYFGGSALILESYKKDIIDSLNSSLSLPIITNDNPKYNGLYKRVSDLLNLTGTFNKGMLNFNELFFETMKDYNNLSKNV